MEKSDLLRKVRTTFFLLIVLMGWRCHPADTKLQQYKVQGEQLYNTHCSNCHQKNGKGLGLVYPPLDVSDFMDENLPEVICMMKYGKEGEILVNGKSYHQPMPGVPSLTELEIAEIATFIYNNWQHERGIIDLATVQQALSNCDQIEP